MESFALKIACVLLPAVFALTACSDARDDLGQETSQDEIAYPPETEQIGDAQDGELGAPSKMEGKETEAPSVVSAPESAGDEATGQTEETFAELDTDDDGYLQESEVKGREQLTQQWDKLDGNGDEQLDSAEFAKFEEQGLEVEGQQKSDAVEK